MNNKKENCSIGNCCGDILQGQVIDEPWVIGAVESRAGKVPRISTGLTWRDRIGSWKVRWGINRMSYKVNPGLYCVGTPDNMSPVLVTGNYKMSFDYLRRELKGCNAWIVVLDTRGVNVWCAAGKGTFGTEELVKRLAIVKLNQVVSHGIIVVPQLGAPGISAHQVQGESGFRVVYGPVRASDIKEFLDNGMKATTHMRKVSFNFYQRLVVTPIELVGTIKLSLVVLGTILLLNILDLGLGKVDMLAYLGALLAGAFFVPLLLPWIPGKAFAWKGWLLGALWAIAFNYINGWPNNPAYGLDRALAYLFLLPPIAAFLAMNFTGASTYTSLSGVIKEMRIATPAIVISLFIGFGIWILV